MSDNLFPHDAFYLFLSLLCGVVAFIWFCYDILKIWRLRNSDGKDPTVHDKRFGYSMGVVIGAIGVIGVLRFNGLL